MPEKSGSEFARRQWHLYGCRDSPQQYECHFLDQNQVTIVNGETITGVDFNNALKSSAVIQGETTTLTTTGIDMIPWLLVASWLMLLGLPALAIGLLQSKKARYNVRP